MKYNMLDLHKTFLMIHVSEIVDWFEYENTEKYTTRIEELFLCAKEQYPEVFK